MLFNSLFNQAWKTQHRESLAFTYSVRKINAFCIQRGTFVSLLSHWFNSLPVEQANQNAAKFFYLAEQHLKLLHPVAKYGTNQHLVLNLYCTSIWTKVLQIWTSLNLMLSLTFSLFVLVSQMHIDQSICVQTMIGWMKCSLAHDITHLWCHISKVISN